jgi:ribose transport system substrate-binding protein
MTLGCAEDVKQSGFKDSVKIVGFDGDKEIYEAIRNGDILGSVIQFPKMIGRVAVDSAIKIINGEKVPHTQYSKIELITKENIQSVNK